MTRGSSLSAAVYITALEHQPLSVGNQSSEREFSHAEADVLSAINEMRRGFCERGYRSVRFAQYSGLLALPDRILEILPKVDDSSSREECRGILLRLLLASDSVPLFRRLTVGHNTQKQPLHEVFIGAFFDAVAEVVRGGLMRRYREHHHDLQVVRGKIAVGRQVTALFNRADVVSCEFDELTADNVWNRLVKAGLHVVKRWIGSVELHRRWVELMAVFSEVEVPSNPHELMERLVFDRHGARYSTVIDWVRWILQNLSPGMRAGEGRAPELLLDTNALFESAIANVLRGQLSGDRSVAVESQRVSGHLATSGGRPRFALKPDIVLRRGGAIVAIADTKWKKVAVDASGNLIPDESDMYQMSAYAAALQCENIALIYPWHSALAASTETCYQLPRIGDLRPTVTVMCADVGEDGFPMRRGSGFMERLDSFSGSE